MNIRVSKFDFVSGLASEWKDNGEAAVLEDAAMLILYFETFYYDKITEYHESIRDFLCKYRYFSHLVTWDLEAISFAAKVGGWIGLVSGASLISFVEFIYFAFQLLKSRFKK